MALAVSITFSCLSYLMLIEVIASELHFTTLLGYKEKNGVNPHGVNYKFNMNLL